MNSSPSSKSRFWRGVILTNLYGGQCFDERRCAHGLAYAYVKRESNGNLKITCKKCKKKK